jgi:hypothetical protein
MEAKTQLMIDSFKGRSATQQLALRNTLAICARARDDGRLDKRRAN